MNPFPWVIIDPSTSIILDSFATSEEAYEATYEDRYGDDVEVGYING